MIDPSRPGDGPIPAQILLVGEYWGQEEVKHNAPFQGFSGIALNAMLHEAGIMRSECYTTNLVNSMPGWSEPPLIPTAKKDIATDVVSFAGAPLGCVRRPFFDAQARLLREVDQVNPNIIVALGNAAMLALTGRWSVLRRRGSQLTTPVGRKLIPTLNPAAVVREWAFRPTVINDLRRAARERATGAYTNVPAWNFIVRPSADRTLAVLANLLAQVDSETLQWIDFDLETSLGYIDCAGISWDRLDAISIPFTTAGAPGYFNAEEEAAVVFALYRLLTHPKVRVRGQNLLYDCQYTHRHWHFVPRVAQDSMISFHSAFAGLRKSLDFQASLLCDYFVQWKPERETWKEGG